MCLDVMLSISILLLKGRVEGKLSLESNIGLWLLDEGNWRRRQRCFT